MVSTAKVPRVIGTGEGQTGTLILADGEREDAEHQEDRPLHPEAGAFRGPDGFGQDVSGCGVGHGRFLWRDRSRKSCRNCERLSSRGVRGGSAPLWRLLSGAKRTCGSSRCG